MQRSVARCAAALLALCVAQVALAGRSSGANGDCPLHKIVLTTKPLDTSQCYPSVRMQTAHDHVLAPDWEPPGDPSEGDPSLEMEAAAWLADSAAAGIRGHERHAARRLQQRQREAEAALHGAAADSAAAAVDAAGSAAEAAAGGAGLHVLPKPAGKGEGKGRKGKAAADDKGKAAAASSFNASAAFNTLLGSIQIGRTYHFTPDPLPLEGAKRMAAAGARMHKFRLSTFAPPEKSAKRIAGLLDAATRPELGYDQLFDLPFTRFIFWAYPVVFENAFEEYYDLAAHLITKYAGSGKAFYIGHWEGDWSIRSQYRDPVIPERVTYFRRQLSEMQRAIDAAKADHAQLLGGEGGVRIWGYAEVNRVLQSMRDPSYKSFVNQVVPYINPPIDFISYSNWEIEEEVERSADELGGVLHAALDFINCHVPPKPCVPEPRTFIGEFGYFLLTKNCTALMAPPVMAGTGPAVPTDPAIVMTRTMWHYAQSVAWGSPFTLFWELYSNEAGKDPATGESCDRGYWLVDTDGNDAPVFTALQAYFAAAEGYVSAFQAANGGALPNFNVFRGWAVGALANLTGYGQQGVAPPPVRQLDLGRAALSGGH